MQSLIQQAGQLLIQTKNSPTPGGDPVAAALVSLGLAQIDFHAGLHSFRQLITPPAKNSLSTPGVPLGQIVTYGIVLAGLYECAPKDVDADAILEECYPNILDGLEKVYAESDPEEEGLITLNDLEESFFPKSLIWTGLQDHKGPVAVQDPLLNSAAVWSNECLIDIGTHLGHDVLELLQWNELAIYSINEKLWNEEQRIYQPYDLQKDTLLAGANIIGFMPMIGEIPDQDRAEEMLKILRGEVFQPLQLPHLSSPTHSPSDPGVDLYTAGKGGISIMANWLLYHGLGRYGMHAAAEKLKKDALQLMADQGFREAYHPVTGNTVPDADIPDLTAAAFCAYWLNEA